MSDADAPLTPTRQPVAVSLAAFVSSFDRFAVSPLLVLVAADLGVSRPAATAAIQALERRLGVRLLHRTTRKLSVTEAGAPVPAGGGASCLPVAAAQRRHHPRRHRQGDAELPGGDRRAAVQRGGLGGCGHCGLRRRARARVGGVSWPAVG